MHGNGYVVPVHDNAASNSPALGNGDQVAYSTEHAARLLDLSRRQIWYLIQRGDLDTIKIGRSRRIPRASLLAYIESLRAAA